MTKQTDEQTLKSLVEKAIGNGWLKEEISIHSILGRKNKVVIEFEEDEERIGVWLSDGGGMSSLFIGSINDLIANHSFMQAIFGKNGCIGLDKKECPFFSNEGKNKAGDITFCFGDNCTYGENESSRFNVGYGHHAQQLIILSESKRIEYLRRVLGV